MRRRILVGARAPLVQDPPAAFPQRRRRRHVPAAVRRARRVSPRWRQSELRTTKHTGHKMRPKQILRALRFARAAEPGLEFGLLLIFLGWGNKLVWLAKLKLETYLGERGHYAARMRREDGHRCCEVNACVPFSLTWATTAPVETSCIFASSRASARLELNSDRCTIRRIRNIKPFGFADESAHGY